MITLYHHPFSRAATVVWFLEEIGQPYELSYVDFAKGEHKKPPFTDLNPMGKLPTLVDNGVVVTEVAAIALYLADRYSYGTLAPKVDDPQRGPYLRWSLFAPSVIEPGAMAQAGGWEFKPSAAGWGEFDVMLQTMATALANKDYLLGSQFSAADMIFGGTLRSMLRFGMVKPTPVFTAYTERLAARPALQRADAKNAAIIAERGLGK